MFLCLGSEEYEHTLEIGLISKSILQLCSKMYLQDILAPFFMLSWATGGSAYSWPDKPFYTNGADMVTSSGAKVVYAGVNWPGAADVMIPEGLQYQSVATIVGKIKSLGMNVIRLTYATEMVDHIYAGDNTSLSTALTTALGSENGTIVLGQILAKNPTFKAQTTRLEVYDAIAAECYKQHIYVHLDNHMSKGEWCCSTDDGNAWFGDTYFNVSNWLRGHKFMANHGKSWPALTSMSLRNELRDPQDNATVEATYNWPTWYDNVVPAINTIHDANNVPLIFLSGLGFDTTLNPIVLGTDLGDGRNFSLSSFKFGNKLVYELHNYENSETSCDATTSLYSDGYMAMNLSDTAVLNHAPVVLTEFGFSQTDSSYEGVYAQCMATLLSSWNSGWMQWVLAGSYYIREGGQDLDESWGLLNHDWSDWRNPSAIENFDIPLVKATLG